MSFAELMKLELGHMRRVRVAEICGESGNDDDENESYSADSVLVGVGMNNWIWGWR